MDAKDNRSGHVLPGCVGKKGSEAQADSFDGRFLRGGIVEPPRIFGLARETSDGWWDGGCRIRGTNPKVRHMRLTVESRAS